MLKLILFCIFFYPSFKSTTFKSADSMFCFIKSFDFYLFGYAKANCFLKNTKSNQCSGSCPDPVGENPYSLDA